MHTSFQNSSLLPQVSPGGAVLWLCGGKLPSSSLGHPKEPGAVGEGCCAVTARGLWPGMCETVTYWYRKCLGVVTAISTVLWAATGVSNPIYSECRCGVVSFPDHILPHRKRKIFFPCGKKWSGNETRCGMGITYHITPYITRRTHSQFNFARVTESPAADYRPVWSQVVTRPGYIILHVLPVLVSNFLVLILLCLSDWAVVLK